MDRNDVVGIANRYRLDGAGRLNAGRGEVSCTSPNRPLGSNQLPVKIPGVFRGCKVAVDVVDHPHQIMPRLKDLDRYSISVPIWSVLARTVLLLFLIELV
jgi:hypothetical protein